MPVEEDPSKKGKKKRSRSLSAKGKLIKKLREDHKKLRKEIKSVERDLRSFGYLKKKKDV